MGSTDLSTTQMTVVIAVSVIILAMYIFIALRIHRRRYRAAFKRIHERAPYGNADLLKELGVEPGTRDAEAAIGVRDVFAQWLRIPAVALTPASQLWRDPDLAPFLDSLDVVELVIMLEERLGVAIHESAFLDHVGLNRGESLGDFIQAVRALLAGELGSPDKSKR